MPQGPNSGGSAEATSQGPTGASVQAPAATSAAELRLAENHLAYLQGQVEALQAQVASLEATDEHRRGELAVAQAEAADANAAVRELRARLEERQRLIESLRDHLASAKQDKEHADSERAALIASLSWGAKRRLSRLARGGTDAATPKA